MQAKRIYIYILMIKVNKLTFLFLWQYFLKEMKKNMFSCFYWVKETLMQVWENSKKLWKHLPACLTVPQHFSFSRAYTLRFRARNFYCVIVDTVFPPDRTFAGIPCCNQRWPQEKWKRGQFGPFLLQGFRHRQPRALNCNRYGCQCN